MEQGRGEEVEAKEQQLDANSGIPTSESDPDPPSTCQSSATDPVEDVVSKSESPANRTDIFKAVEVVERDSLAIAESFSSLFGSLRLVLSEVRRLFFSSLFLLVFGWRESK